jgi:hypothetical protein
MGMDGISKGDKMMQKTGGIAIASFTIIFCSLLIFQLAPADLCKAVYNKKNVNFDQYESTPERYSQNPEGGYWEQLANQKFPLALMDWRLVTNPASSDKYVDKRLMGTVKNNSEKEFSEVKIEFTVYDEEGAQIAVVLSSVYDFKPGSIWKFEIPVTSDVGKAELKGLYIPKNELGKSEKS